jgi:hypothetical protein
LEVGDNATEFVGCLLYRFVFEPIKPVADRFLYNIVAVSQFVQLVALFAPDRRENTFSRLPFVYLLFELVELLKRDTVKPTHYRLYCIYW